MAERTGRQALIEQLRADGTRYMFGNPGTVEQGFLDELSGFPDIEYVLALQETVAVGIADGYARGTQAPAIVQLHSGVGLGNGIGMLYQALRGHSPLVVLAGEAGLRYDAMEAQMSADLVAMAKPVTKWATRVVHPDSLLRVIRRAVKVASTPPMGPVFVALPMDVLDAPSVEEVVQTSVPHTRSVPCDADVRRAVELLVGSARPLVIAGDGVTAAAAQGELAEVAALLGAQVWGADWSENNIDTALPQFGGLLGHMFGAHSAAVTSTADAVLICGTYLLPEVFPALSGVFAPDARIVHIDQNGWEIAKNFPVDLGLVADPKLTLAAIAGRLRKTATPEQRERALARLELFGEERDATHHTEVAADRAGYDRTPLRAAQFAEELARQLPPDAIVFDEALTSSPEICRHLRTTRPGQYFQTRGGSLGVGIPGAIGLKLAHPDRTVVAFTGDGGSMYTFQALWTAAKHEVDAVFVVCNNHSYELLKVNIAEYWRELGIAPHPAPASFDLAEPEIDFARLAESLGVPGTRVEKPDQIGPAISAALAHRGPYLIDLVIGNQTGD